MPRPLTSPFSSTRNSSFPVCAVFGAALFALGSVSANAQPQPLNTPGFAAATSSLSSATAVSNSAVFGASAANNSAIASLGAGDSAVASPGAGGSTVASPGVGASAGVLPGALGLAIASLGAGGSTVASPGVGASAGVLPGALGSAVAARGIVGSAGLLPVAPPDPRFAQRREAIMDALSDGVLLLHARADIKRFRETGFHQDPNFFYFTGLDNVTNAILAIDGPSRESWLFVPPASAAASGGFAALARTWMKPGGEAEQATGIERVVGWRRFAEFVDERAGGKLYVPSELDGHSSNPPGMAPVADPDVLWLHAIGLRWPTADIVSAADVIRELRSIKDAGEVAALRKAGEASVEALLAGLRQIAPDVEQRRVEAAVVAGCLNAGGDGVGFWPWIMSGANSVIPMPFASFGDYRHLNRSMQAGELVRVDIGCEADFYQGDVGRTIPVSGTFSPGQHEAWNLLVTAYHAGLDVMKDGVAWEVVEEAAREAVRTIVDDDARAPKTALGKQAVDILLSDDRVEWHYHGIGLWASEPPEPVLLAGMVIDFEPMFALDGQGYYLEDMIHITADGYEILTTGLPYSATEIEALMRGQ